MKEGRNADCVDETDDGGRIGVGDLEEIGDESVVGCGGGDGDNDDGDNDDDL